METFLLEAAKQVPALAVLAWIVFKFIGFAAQSADRMADISSRFSRVVMETEEKRNETLKSIGHECHTVQKEAISVIGQVKEVLHENTAVLKEVNERLRQTSALNH